MPPKSHRSDYIILATLGAITIVVVAVLASAGWLRKEEPEHMPVRTTHSTRAEGTMACYMLFDRLDVEVRRSERPLLAEALQKLDVVFVIDPILPVERTEVSALRDWIRSGGVLVRSRSGFYMSSGGGSFHARPVGEEQGSVSSVAEDASELPLARDVSTVLFQTLDDVGVDEAEPFDAEGEGAELFADSAGTRIVAHSIGDGYVIVLADGSFLANTRLGEEDNAILAANLVTHALSLARGERVAFDEYHFGYGSRQTGWSLLRGSLLRTSPGWAVLCLMVAGGLFLVYRGRRFGTRYPPSRPRRRSKLEYVRSVGATYRAAGAHGLTFEIVYGWFRRTAAAAVGLPPSASSGTLADRLARKTLRSAQRYRGILTECEAAAAEPRLSGRRAAALLSELAAIESEVLHGRRARK